MDGRYTSPPLALCALVARRIQAALSDGRLARDAAGHLVVVRRLTDITGMVECGQEHSITVLVEEAYAAEKVLARDARS